MKRILVLLLVAMMIIAPGALAWASNTGDNASITVLDDEGQTVVSDVYENGEEEATEDEEDEEVAENEDAVENEDEEATEATEDEEEIDEDVLKELNQIKELKKQLKKQWINDKNNFQKAVKEHRKALKEAMKHQQKMYKNAWKNEMKGYQVEMADLMNQYKELQERMKNDREKLLALSYVLKDKADFCQEVEDYEGAEEALEEAAEATPKDDETYEKLNEIYKKLGKKELKAFVKGKKPNFDVPPMIKDGRTLVPFRKLAEGLGAIVTYNPTDRTITLVKDENTVVLTLGSKIALVNGEEQTLDVAAQLVGSRTLVPLRFISEGLKADVKWYSDTKTIVVNE